jgi:hypothetical protein
MGRRPCGMRATIDRPSANAYPALKGPRGSRFSGGIMVEYALLIGHNALGSLAMQVDSLANSVNWALVGAVVGGLLFVRFALKPPRVR